MNILPKKGQKTYFIGLISVYRLPNTVNDVKALRDEYLIPELGIKETDMKIITNGTREQFSYLKDDSYISAKSTAGVSKAFRDIVGNFEKGKEEYNLVILVASHGKRDMLGETYLEWGKQVKITGDELSKYYLSYIPENARTLILVDTCHGGGLIDVDMKSGERAGEGKYKAKINVLCGCEEDEVAEETYDIKTGKMMGSLVKAFVKSYRDEDMMGSIRKYLEKHGQKLVVGESHPENNNVSEKENMSDHSEFVVRSDSNCDKHDDTSSKKDCPLTPYDHGRVHDDGCGCNKCYNKCGYGQQSWWWIIVLIVIILLLLLVWWWAKRRC
ncbi:Hypothetical protein ORPV_1118 [Orpheovirus IHUMI-LCC2]|uniref:Uncharacterized protein n=1 Tax=Orpheovirus IHUMI-LCC2 TaxID=2023057 RepID=A0A2I2L650_9VIRU|nr:Hypothetical protein ORPV_1118 [Orpheovirus IHUMI-LCC2]SNW63022.1 Hypothetical protein ORPV_1118 [Orpheovirus IHUMI-LCC2]